MYVGEKKESKKVQCHTHKLAMHRRKGWNMGFWMQGVFVMFCAQWKTEPAEGMRLGKGMDGILWESSILSSAVQYSSDVLDRGQIGQEWHQIGQLGIMGVIKPRGNRDGIIWMEDVRCRGVV